MISNRLEKKNLITTCESTTYYKTELFFFLVFLFQLLSYFLVGQEAEKTGENEHAQAETSSEAKPETAPSS